MRPDPQSYGARGWMAALGYVFGAETRRRGMGYVTRVDARVDEAGIVRAAVPGSRPAPYQVGFAADGVDATTALAACSCPMGDAQIPCKHLFAVLCALDLAGVRRNAPAPDRLELTDIDDDALVPIGALHRIGQRAGGAAARAPAPTWRERFEPWPTPRPRTGGKPARIEYVVCAEPVAEDTVEAKILALQDHKRALFAGVFEDKGVVGRLTVDDLRDLLA